VVALVVVMCSNGFLSQEEFCFNNSIYFHFFKIKAVLYTYYTLKEKTKIMAEDFRVSVSKTKTFIDCAAKYKFCYVEKLPRKDWDFHIFGKFCHMVLEEFHKEYLEGCQLPYNVVMGTSYKKALKEYKDKMTPEMKKECWSIIDKYLRKISNEKNTGTPANVIGVEKRFELPVGENIILNGAIDRIQIDDDNVIHVGDYKTVKNKKYLKNDFFQLITYAYVLMSEDPSITKVRASYILLRYDFEYITTEFTKDEVMKVKDQYINYVNQMIAEKEFKPNPTALCNYCDYQNLCPEGKAKSFGNHNIYGEVSY
jgi:RecB family exonuclease